MAEQSSAASLDTDTVQLILSNHQRLKERRAFYESTWREIDRFVDPTAPAVGTGQTDV
jgi:hypothetical protein